VPPRSAPGPAPTLSPLLGRPSTTLGEPPLLPYLPELPSRGPGADLVGRSAALLVDMPVDLQPSGWRLVDHPGPGPESGPPPSCGRISTSWRKVADGYTGRLKLQVAGPWTLASALWLPRLERAVVDPGRRPRPDRPPWPKGSAGM